MYVLFEGWQVGLNLTPDEGADCVKFGEMVKVATREQYPSVHPANPELTGPTIAMITGNPVSPDAHGRNTVVISTGESCAWYRARGRMAPFQRASETARSDCSAVTTVTGRPSASTR